MKFFRLILILLTIFKIQVGFSEPMLDEPSAKILILEDDLHEMLRTGQAIEDPEKLEEKVASLTRLARTAPLPAARRHALVVLSGLSQFGIITQIANLVKFQSHLFSHCYTTLECLEIDGQRNLLQNSGINIDDKFQVEIESKRTKEFLEIVLSGKSLWKRFIAKTNLSSASNKGRIPTQGSLTEVEMKEYLAAARALEKQIDELIPKYSLEDDFASRAEKRVNFFLPIIEHMMQEEALLEETGLDQYNLTATGLEEIITEVKHSLAAISKYANRFRLRNVSSYLDKINVSEENWYFLIKSFQLSEAYLPSREMWHQKIVAMGNELKMRNANVAGLDLDSELQNANSLLIRNNRFLYEFFIRSGFEKAPTIEDELLLSGYYRRFFGFFSLVQENSNAVVEFQKYSAEYELANSTTHKSAEAYKALSSRYQAFEIWLTTACYQVSANYLKNSKKKYSSFLPVTEEHPVLNYLNGPDNREEEVFSLKEACPVFDPIGPETQVTSYVQGRLKHLLDKPWKDNVKFMGITVATIFTAGIAAEIVAVSVAARAAAVGANFAGRANTVRNIFFTGKVVRSAGHLKKLMRVFSLPQLLHTTTSGIIFTEVQIRAMNSIFNLNEEPKFSDYLLTIGIFQGMGISKLYASVIAARGIMVGHQLAKTPLAAKSQTALRYSLLKNSPAIKGAEFTGELAFFIALPSIHLRMEEMLLNSNDKEVLDWVERKRLLGEHALHTSFILLALRGAGMASRFPLRAFSRESKPAQETKTEKLIPLYH